MVSVSMKVQLHWWEFPKPWIQGIEAQSRVLELMRSFLFVDLIELKIVNCCRWIVQFPWNWRFLQWSSIRVFRISIEQIVMEVVIDGAHYSSVIWSSYVQVYKNWPPSSDRIESCRLGFFNCSIVVERTSSISIDRSGKSIYAFVWWNFCRERRSSVSLSVCDRATCNFRRISRLLVIELLVAE